MLGCFILVELFSTNQRLLTQKIINGDIILIIEKTGNSVTFGAQSSLRFSFQAYYYSPVIGCGYKMLSKDS